MTERNKEKKKQLYIEPERSTESIKSYTSSFDQDVINRITKELTIIEPGVYDPLNGETTYNLTERSGIRAGDELELATRMKDLMLTPIEKMGYSMLLDELYKNFKGQKKAYTLQTDEFLAKTTVKLTVDNFIKQTGKPDTPATRQEAKKTLKRIHDSLLNIRITHTFTTYEEGKQKNRPVTVPLLAAASDGHEYGSVSFMISPLLALYFTEYAIKKPKNIYKINQLRAPAGFEIAYYLNTIYETNRNNGKEPDECGKISVKSIISNSNIPGLTDKTRHYAKQQIKGPLTAALLEIRKAGVIKEGFYFLNKETNEKYYSMIDVEKLPIDLFIELLLRYEMAE